MESLSEFYSENYKDFIGTGLVGKVASLSHKSMERKKFRERAVGIFDFGAWGG